MYITVVYSLPIFTTRVFVFPVNVFETLFAKAFKVHVEEQRWRFHTRVQLLQLVYVPSN